MSRQQGVAEDKIKALSEFEESECLTDIEKLCIRYAVEMTKTPTEVPDSMMEELKTCFNEKQLVELTSAIAWEHYRARFDHALSIGSAGLSDRAFCPLPDRHPARVA